MLSAFDYIGAKIERSHEQIGALAGQMQVVFDRQYAIRRYTEETTGDYVEVFDDEISIPLKWSIIVGEILHQLRSSLDNVVWALVQKNNAVPTEANMFPVYTFDPFKSNDPKRNIPRFEGKIGGLSDASKRIILGFQPYNSNAPNDELLAKLDKLNNTDKHRKLNIIAGHCGRPKSLNIKGTFQRGVLMRGGNFLERGAELMRVKAAPPDLDVVIQHDFVPVLNEDGSLRFEPIIPLLGDIHNCVLDVMSALSAES